MNPTAEVVVLTDSLSAYLSELECSFYEHMKLPFTTVPFDQEHWLKVEQRQNALVDQYIPQVTQVLDDTYGSLTELIPNLSQQEALGCRAYHRARIEPFFFQVPFVRRVFDRPLGYMGDYVVNEMLFENKDSGLSPFARLLSHYALNTGPARAHRGRLPWIHGHLRRHVSNHTDQLLKVCSFSCGPEHILRQFVAEGGRCEITLCDHDTRALEYCRRQFQKILRKTGTDLPLHSIELSASDVLNHPVATNRLHQTVGENGYDIILVPGLLDYLKAPALSKFLDCLATLLRLDGEILLTNVNVNNPWRSFMEYIGDWYVIARSKDELSDLVQGNPARFSTIELLTDETGTNLYYAGRKVASGLHECSPAIKL
jgi:extracellular factor (EF) 3-hydroxypalmitic acid methyl ester biosynthesis protein